jgi:hypothetical protein
MRTTVTAFALLGLLCGSAAAAGLANGRAGSAVSAEVVADQLATTQREVRQALVDATVAPTDMNELMTFLASFVTNYTSLVTTGDPDASEFSLEDYLAGKVVPVLRQAALSSAETERIVTLTSTWVGLEFSRIDAGAGRPAVDAGRLDREVRR